MMTHKRSDTLQCSAQTCGARHPGLIEFLKLFQLCCQGQQARGKGTINVQELNTEH